MRLFFRGLGLALPLLLVHVACGGDDGGGSSSGGVTPGNDSGPGDPGTNPGADGGGTDGSKPGEDSGPPPPPPVVNDTNETLDVDGVMRSYVLSVPVDYNAAKTYPLVVSFHGDGGDGPSMRATFPFDGASQKDAIIAYPSGMNNTWQLYVPKETNADMKFVTSLIDDLAGKYNIDKNKVLGFGYSNGAFFINQIACKLPGTFRAISSHEGGAPSESGQSNAYSCPGATVAAFVFHGDADGTVDPGSGKFDAKVWATLNGCTAKDTSQYVDLDPAPPCTQSPSCPGATPVTFCLVPGLGHSVWDRGAEVTWKYWNALP